MNKVLKYTLIFLTIIFVAFFILMGLAFAGIISDVIVCGMTFGLRCKNKKKKSNSNEKENYFSEKKKVRFNDYVKFHRY